MDRIQADGPGTGRATTASASIRCGPTSRSAPEGDGIARGARPAARL